MTMNVYSQFSIHHMTFTERSRYGFISLVARRMPDRHRPTLYRPLEKCFASLAGRDSVMKSAGNVTADETEPPGHHVILLQASL